MRYTIEHHKELASTNTLALEYLRKGRAEGTVIWTDYQTAGRGKPGAKWLSPPGKNLLFSVIVKPPIKAHQAPLLTQIVCRSVAHVLESRCGLSAQFKKPNDVFVRGKKICGILTETYSTPKGKLDGVVIGIGLNVNSGSDELIPGATSLYIVTGKKSRLSILLKAILAEIKINLESTYVGTS